MRRTTADRVSVVYLAASIAIAAWLMPTGTRAAADCRSRRLARRRSGRLSAAAPEAARTDALRRASRVDRLRHGVCGSRRRTHPIPSGTLSEPIVRCRYLDGPARGTTAKFDCVLADGEVVKVKYGHTGEIQAEIAASRLLTALGFGADRMYLVPRLRCYGCVRTPVLHQLAARQGARPRAPRCARCPTDATPTSNGPRSNGTSAALPIEPAGTTGLGLVRARSDRSLARRRPRRSATRCASRPCCSRTGTTRRPTSGWSASRRRRTAPAPCPRPFALINDLGRDLRPEQGGSRSLEGGADLERPRALHRQHATVSIQRQHVSGHRPSRRPGASSSRVS